MPTPNAGYLKPGSVESAVNRLTSPKAMLKAIVADAKKSAKDRLKK